MRKDTKHIIPKQGFNPTHPPKERHIYWPNFILESGETTKNVKLAMSFYYLCNVRITTLNKTPTVMKLRKGLFIHRESALKTYVVGVKGKHQVLTPI